MPNVQYCLCGLVKQKPQMVGGVKTCVRCYKPIDVPPEVVEAMRQQAAQEAQDREEAGRLYKANPFVTTLDFIPRYEVDRTIGVVYATNSTMGAKAKDDKGSLINRLEGRLEHATRESLIQLWEKARAIGANAVVGVRIAAAESEGSGISSARATGIVVIGTAVIVTEKVA